MQSLGGRHLWACYCCCHSVVLGLLLCRPSRGHARLCCGDIIIIIITIIIIIIIIIIFFIIIINITIIIIIIYYYHILFLFLFFYFFIFQDLPELWALHHLLPSVAKQLTHVASRELLPLMEISGVREVRREGGGGEVYREGRRRGRRRMKDYKITSSLYKDNEYTLK